MIITWYGHSYFKIETKDLVLAIDPFTEKSCGLTPSRIKADILLISHNHLDHNNEAIIMGEPMVIKGPGEVEKKGVFIDGLASFHDNQQGRERGLNTIFLINSEMMKICHLGDLGEKRLKEEALEKVAGTDILLVPVGGFYTLEIKEVVSLINQLEPKIVIPMHYQLPNIKSELKLNALSKFVNEFGKKPEVLEKLVIKKNQLPTETKLIVLQQKQ